MRTEEKILIYTWDTPKQNKKNIADSSEEHVAQGRGELGHRSFGIETTGGGWSLQQAQEQNQSPGTRQRR